MAGQGPTCARSGFGQSCSTHWLGLDSILKTNLKVGQVLVQLCVAQCKLTLVMLRILLLQKTVKGNDSKLFSLVLFTGFVSLDIRKNQK